jgi:hypothetical protein
MNKTIIIMTSLFFFCVGLVGGIVIQKMFFSQQKDPNDTFAAGWASAKQRLVSTGNFQGVGNDSEVKSISGAVKKVENNIITIKSVPLGPLSDPNLDERYIEVNKDTKITAFIKKSNEQIQREVIEQQKNGKEQQIHNADNAVGVGEYYSETESVNQIATGNHVIVYSDQGIGDKKEFIAKEITVVK